MTTTRKAAARPTAARRARTTSPSTVRPHVAELLESAAWTKAALRGEPVEGGRAWLYTSGVAGQPATLTAVPVAEVARRVAEARGAGTLAEPNAAAIRQQAGLSQAAFAAVLDVPISTLRNWEQGRRAPRGPARQLLRVAAAAPEVLRVLQGAQALAPRGER